MRTCFDYLENNIAVIVLLFNAIGIQILAVILVVAPAQFQREIEVRIGTDKAFYLLLDAKTSALLSRGNIDWNGPQTRQCELHPAGRTRSTSLGKVQMQLIRSRSPLRDVIPQIDILTDRAVDSTDIAYQLVIQEQPQIIIAEEAVVQRPGVPFRNGELKIKLHSEIGVVQHSVIVGIRCWLFIHAIGHFSLTITELEIMPICAVRRVAIHRPEII